jgi:hypothetical protein
MNERMLELAWACQGALAGGSALPAGEAARRRARAPLAAGRSVRGGRIGRDGSIGPVRSEGAPLGIIRLVLNVQFLLSLFVASIVPYWRFQAGRKNFGENRFDCGEAFATGFAVDLAAIELPEKIAAIMEIRTRSVRRNR